jgi:hypothetical protein
MKSSELLLNSLLLLRKFIVIQCIYNTAQEFIFDHHEYRQASEFIYFGTVYITGDKTANPG